MTTILKEQNKDWHLDNTHYMDRYDSKSQFSFVMTRLSIALPVTAVYDTIAPQWQSVEPEYWPAMELYCATMPC